jgi:pimeloyl-ACP methyl ester carboxylesterase
MPALEARGVELAWSERGEGAAIALIHETGTAAAVWEPVLDALSNRARAISYDRRGWGASSAPEGYLRTTIEEQSEDAAVVIDAAVAAPAAVCGAGIGAVIALDLMIRRPELVAGALLLEPPLLGLVPGATEALSADRRRFERALAEGGVAGVVDLYLSGGLPALGPGAERLPPELTAPARRAPRIVLAEIGATAGWSMPLSRFGSAARPSVIAISAVTPSLIAEAAITLAGRLRRSELRRLDGTGIAKGPAPPHLAAPAEVAAAAQELLAAGQGR